MLTTASRPHANGFQAARQRAEAGGQGAEFWGRLVGRGAFEVGTAALPAGLATKGLEGASLLGRAGKVSELLGAAAHGAKAGRGVGAAARAGQAKAVFEAPSGLGGLAAPRTPGLGDCASMSELVQSGAIPGIKGVTLTDRVGNPVELYGGMFKLSQQNGIEYALTREGDELVLRSGAPDRVRIPSHAEPVAHTHPFDPETELPQKLPSRADVNVLNDRWSSDPDGPRPSSDIVWGPEPDHVTRYHATGLDRIPDPTKRGLKPGRIW